MKTRFKMKILKSFSVLAFSFSLFLSFAITANAQSPLDSYRVEIYSMTCLEEDDPGGEIEIYGRIQAQLDYRGRNRRVDTSRKTIWIRSESKPFEMDEGEVYYRKGSAIIKIPRNEIRTVRINLSEQLAEDDGSSGDDKFRINTKACSSGYHSWSSSDGRRMKTIMFVEGDTRLQVKWRVVKL